MKLFHWNEMFENYSQVEAAVFRFAIHSQLNLIDIYYYKILQRNTKYLIQY